MKTREKSIKYASPLGAVVVLVVIIANGGVDARPPRNAEAYFAASAESILSIPYRIGGWYGEDQAVTAPARKLLKPNQVMQRRYTELSSGDRFSLLLVHCKNTRDMDGHYPPICYDRHGWNMIEAEKVLLKMTDAKGEPVHATQYRFERRSNPGQVMNVLGFFIIPAAESPYSPGIDTLRVASRGRSSAGMGAAQVQVITYGTFTDERRNEIINMVIDEIEPVLDVIAKGDSDE
jgi:Protein of unknown function (DUF3485)